MWVITGLATFLEGLGKGGGGLVGALTTAMIALVLPPEKVIGLVLPLLMVGDIFAVAAHLRQWDRGLILQLVPSTILGVTLAQYLLYRISGEGLRLALGLIVLVFVAYKLLEGTTAACIPASTQAIPRLADRYHLGDHLDVGAWRWLAVQHFPDYPGPGAEEVRGYGDVLFLSVELDESPLVFGCRVIRFMILMLHLLPLMFEKISRLTILYLPSD